MAVLVGVGGLVAVGVRVDVGVGVGLRVAVEVAVGMGVTGVGVWVGRGVGVGAWVGVAVGGGVGVAIKGIIALELWPKASERAMSAKMSRTSRSSWIYRSVNSTTICSILGSARVSSLARARPSSWSCAYAAATSRT